MKYPEVTSLFKYYPIGKNQLSALAQKQIWYSKPSGFNDPFDTRFYVKGELRAFIAEKDGSKIKAAFDDDMSGALVYKKVSLQDDLSIFENEIEELGILSLADSNINLLMWSHYANEHKGMCLEFHREKGTELANHQVTQPIFYTDNHPTLTTKSLKDSSLRSSSKRRILYAKSKHWVYEQEWRHIVNAGNKLYPWPAPLKAVYFGCKAEEQDIHLVKTIINDANVKYSKANLNTTTFGMTFDPI